MDLEAINEVLVPIIVLACLIVGYVIKATPKLRGGREFIPFIVCVLGAVLGGVVNGFTVEAIVIGAASGLSSTGINQAFRKGLLKMDKSEVQEAQETEDEQENY